MVPSLEEILGGATIEGLREDAKKSLGVWVLPLGRSLLSLAVEFLLTKNKIEGL